MKNGLSAFMIMLLPLFDQKLFRQIKIYLSFVAVAIFISPLSAAASENTSWLSGPNFRLYSETATEREMQGSQIQNQALIGYGFQFLQDLTTKLQVGASQYSGDSVAFNHQSRYGTHVRLVQNLVVTNPFKLNLLIEYQDHQSGSTPYSYGKWGFFGGHYVALGSSDWSTDSYFESLLIPELNNKKPSVFGRISLNRELIQHNSFSLKLFGELAAQNEVENWSYEYAEARLGSSLHYSDWISLRGWYRAWKDRSESRLPNEKLQDFGAVLTIQFEGDL